MSGADTLCVMPTGAGKSICYQVPAIAMGGVSVVISPLISLMKDQVDQLKQSGVSAESINSAMSWDEVRPIFWRVRSGDIRLLYIAPERLGGAGFREFLKDIDLRLFVVDEAHCVSHWGHDFRPSYMSIAPAVASLPARPPVAAFTATATPEVREDIAKELGLVSPKTIITGFDRENLFFQVEQPADKDAFLLDYIKRSRDMPGIVYCSTRKSVERVSEMLRRSGVPAVRYHAGLDDAERSRNQDDFIYDRALVMVATNAFGMGIDKSNVRFVIHYNMPQSLDSYYQEAGRAGRDDTPADCVLLFSPGDVSTIRYLISRTDDVDARRTALVKMGRMADYANSSDCLRRSILNYFGETDVPENCGRCGNCSAMSERSDVTLEAKKIVSCVYRIAQRTGGRWFGAKVIADVLKGRSDHQVKSWGLDDISTWGIMRETELAEIRQMIDLLAAMKILSKSLDEIPVIRLSARSMEFLKSERRILMRKFGSESRPAAVSIRRKKRGREDAAFSEAKVRSFERLRALRKEISVREGVPPYVIFSDRTLLAICDIDPRTREQMMSVPGIGQVKMSRYGEEFLEMMARWRKEDEEG